MFLDISFVPKNRDRILRVLQPGRISQPTQDPLSIVCTQNDGQRWLENVYKGQAQYHRVGEQASGYVGNRPSMVEIHNLIETGEWDLLLATELREIYRDPEYMWKTVNLCLQFRTRMIVFNDNIDTARHDWPVSFHTASLRAGLAGFEVKTRVTRKASFTFDTGGMVQKYRFGYRKLSKEEAKSGSFGPKGLEIARVDECSSIIREMMSRVLAGESYESVARWLNDEGVPPGPYVENGWSGKLVRDILADPIMSGTRTFRDVCSESLGPNVPALRTPNPNPERRHYPELAHLTREEHDQLLEVMDRRKDHEYLKGHEHPRWRCARSDNTWPCQHPRCGICGGLMYDMGTFLKCENALGRGDGTCWNHVQAKIAEIRARVIPWVLGVLGQYPTFRDRMIDAAWREFERENSRRRTEDNSLDLQIDQLEAEAKNLVKAVRVSSGRIADIVDELEQVRAQIARMQEQRFERDKQWQAAGEFLSREDVESRLNDAVMQLATSSFEFARLMRRLLPDFTIHPVQGLDCPQVRPRAKLTLNLAAWAPEGEETPPPTTTSIDVFEPPIHVECLPRCLEAKVKAVELSIRPSLKNIAGMIGVSYMTVKRALDYVRRMESAGTTDPFRELHEKPANASRWNAKKPKGDVSQPSA